MMYLSFTPARPGATEFVVVDKATNPTMRPWVLNDAQEWGNPAWEHEFSGARGTQGAASAQGVLPNRVVRLTLRLYGTSDDDVANRLSELQATIDLMRRFGGVITRRTHRQTHRQHLRVITTPGVQTGAWDKKADRTNLLDVGLEFVCEPYAEGDPMAWDQKVQSAAGLATLETVTGPALTLVGADLDRSRPTTANTRSFALDALRRYAYGDVRMSAQYRTDAAANDQEWGVMLRYVDAENWLYVGACNISAGGILRIRGCVGGVESTFSSTALPASVGAVGAYQWTVGWIDGNTVSAQYLTRSDPSPYNEHSAPAGTLAYVLSTAQAAALGAGVTGRVGLVSTWAGVTAEAGMRRLVCQPYFYGGTNRPTLDTIHLLGPIPGDAPAKASVAVTTPAANTVAARWALLSWASRRGARNLCWNGAFEEGIDGWTGSAVTGVSGAAQAIAHLTSNSASGAGSLSVDATTTDTSGAAFRMFHRFRRGITYRATISIQRGGVPGAFELCLGRNGDLSVGAAAVPAAPAGSFSTRTVDWTPTADATDAYVAIRADGTHGDAVVVDEVRVVELPHGAAFAHQAEGSGGYSPLGVVPAIGHEQETGTTDTTATSLVGDLESAGVISGAGFAALSYLIDPSLVDPDDYTRGELAVEVWARVTMDDDLIGLRGALWANPPAAAYDADTLGARRTAAPGGLNGRALTVPATVDASRLVRLGIVNLAIDPDRPGPWRVTARFSWAAGSVDSFTVDYLAFAIARTRISSPTGVQESLGGYPAFIDTHADEVTKIVRSDLSAVVQAPPSTGLYPDHGLGGSTLLEMPAGNVDLMVLLSDFNPDDPGSTDNSAAVSMSAAVAVSPVPRWAYLRSA